MKYLFASILLLSVCSCSGKHDDTNNEHKAKKDNVLQTYVEQPLNQAKEVSKKVADEQKKALDQAASDD